MPKGFFGEACDTEARRLVNGRPAGVASKEVRRAPGPDELSGRGPMTGELIPFGRRTGELGASMCEDMFLPLATVEHGSPSRHTVLFWKLTRWTAPLTVVPLNGDQSAPAWNM